MARIITLTPNPALDYSAEVEKVAPNRKLRCEKPLTYPGGGGVNVSRAVGRLGAETLAIFTAGGVYGAALSKAVADEGVPSCILAVGGETRLSYAVREISTGDEFRFGLPGAQLLPAESDALLAALDAEVRPGDYVVGSGSLPPGADPNFWARAARASKAQGAKFVLDSTSGVREALSEGVSVLRLNKSEAPALAARDLDWPEGAAGFAWSIVESGGAERVVVTQGAEGGVMASEAGVSRCPSFEVPVASAVGAGDSFVAALVHALMNGESESRALRWGFAAAAATLMTPGTALFDPAVVRRLFESGRP